MRSKTVSILLLLFILLSVTANVSADAIYTNDIDITDSISFTINETYTDMDAREFRQTLDADKSGNVTVTEIEQFKTTFLNTRSIEFGGYLLIDDGAVPLQIESVEMGFVNAGGNINTEPINVTTVITYEIMSPIPSGEHQLWILGHPLIHVMKITLPSGMDVVSVDGLDNMTTSTENGRIILEGRSGVRSFMVKDRPTFEYATAVNIYKKPFYAKSCFLLSLAITEVLLAALALYMIKKQKVK